MMVLDVADGKPERLASIYGMEMPFFLRFYDDALKRRRNDIRFQAALHGAKLDEPEKNSSPAMMGLASKGFSVQMVKVSDEEKARRRALAENGNR